MPNWCENTIIISPDVEKDKFKIFCDSLKDENGGYFFRFNKHVPRPTTKDDDWYNWNCENWGTKWDAEDPFVEMKHGKLYINCLTAWSPPVPWVRKVSNDFGVKIKLTYKEEGMMFQGEYIKSSFEEVNNCWNIENEESDLEEKSDAV